MFVSCTLRTATFLKYQAGIIRIPTIRRGLSFIRLVRAVAGPQRAVGVKFHALPFNKLCWGTWQNKSKPMKTKVVISILLCSMMLFTQCKKEKNSPTSPGNGTTTQPGCVTNNTGVVYFTNKYSDPYKLEINGSYVGTVSGGSTANPTKSSGYTASAGTISYKATQASGYTFWPTVYSNTAPLTQCSDVTIGF